MSTQFIYDRSEKAENGCWNWTRYVEPNGYGVGWFKGRLMKAHRISAVIFKGFVPTPVKGSRGTLVLHICDNRRCVNPDHLYIGTQADNMRDCVARGRVGNHKGTTNGRAKLTPRKVDIIRSRLAQGESQVSIAAYFGVGQTQISKIKRNKAWGQPS